MSTNFPNGVMSKGVPLNGNGPITSGKHYFVSPYRGSNGNSGLRPDQAFADVNTAYAHAISGNGDVIHLLSEGTTTAHITSYITSTLTWAKEKTHLIGEASPTGISPRARLASTSTSVGLAPLLKVTASGCIFANFQVYVGVASDATSLGAIEVTGERNYFYRVHAAGIGHADNDAAGAYSLKLTGGGENLFEECVIGIDTIARGTAANSELLLASSTARNKFLNSTFRTFAEAAGHQFIIAGASAIERSVEFENCLFFNPDVSTSAVAMTEAIDIHATQNGTIILRNCTLVGAADWEAGDEGLVLIDGAAATAGTSGIAVATTA